MITLLKNPYPLLIISLALSFVFSSCSKDSLPGESTASQELGDVTNRMVQLGNPLSEKYKDNTERVYARNVWDMYAFNNKIYFGGGNSSNSGPAVNAGPADLWSYDLNTKSFIMEYTTHDEQIHLIREIDNQLYLPGHDSRYDTWSYGNFYRLEPGGWKEYHIPYAIHVYDIQKSGNKLFASIGPYYKNSTPNKDRVSSIQVSDDNGINWHNARFSNGMREEYVTYRVYSLFTIAGDLSFRTSRYTGKDDLFELAKFQGLGNPLYNGIVGATRIERAVVFGDQTVYIAVKGDNDHQYLPLALRCAKDMQQVSDLPLPKGSLPRDILVKGKNLVVLVSQKNTDKTYRNTVILTTNLSSEEVTWKELFHFTAGSFARSFEYLNGVFYFGLGCETDLLAPETGDILSFGYRLP